MTYIKNSASLKRWEDDLVVSVAKEPQPWNEYDNQIHSAVLVFNSYLAGKAFFPPMDWHFIKALVWVESGPHAQKDAWHIRPMQIGNGHDDGLGDLLRSPQTKLVMPPQLRAGLNWANTSTQGRFNIIAGIGYLLLRMANFGIVLGPPPACDPRNYQPVTDRAIIGNLDSPLSNCVMDRFTGDRIPVKRPLTPLNPAHFHHPRPPQGMAAPRVAHMSIIGWRMFTPEMVSKRYNGGGDGNYADKLAFAYKLVTSTS